MQSTSKILSNDDLLEASKKILKPEIFDFISGGSGSEWSVKNNLDIFHQIQIVPRVLQKSGTIDTSVSLPGKNLSFPVIIAPCAFHKLVCEDGELATAKAAAKCNTILTLSTMSSCSMEDVASVSNNDKWFQLYLFKDQRITEDLVRRAEIAGYEALVVTVDLPAMGMRLRDIRNQFSLPKHIEAVNLKKFHLSDISEKSEGSKVKEHTDQQFDANIGWDTIDWLRSITSLPIFLKGILNVEDAIESLNHDIQGIIISNHGGRQIDGVVSPIEVLPEIAKMVNNKVPLIVDGGIRCGEDIFKAIALGANAVMIGRPVLWALSVGGESELESLLTRLQKELILAMRLAGCNSLQIVRDRGFSLLAGEKITNMKWKEMMMKMENNHVSENIKITPSARFFLKPI